VSYVFFIIAVQWRDVLPWNWGSDSSYVELPALKTPSRVPVSKSSLTPLGEVSGQPIVVRTRRDLVSLRTIPAHGFGNEGCFALYRNVFLCVFPDLRVRWIRLKYFSKVQRLV